MCKIWVRLSPKLGNGLNFNHKHILRAKNHNNGTRSYNFAANLVRCRFFVHLVLKTLLGRQGTYKKESQIGKSVSNKDLTLNPSKN